MWLSSGHCLLRKQEGMAAEGLITTQKLPVPELVLAGPEAPPDTAGKPDPNPSEKFSAPREPAAQRCGRAAQARALERAPEGAQLRTVEALPACPSFQRQRRVGWSV